MRYHVSGGDRWGLATSSHHALLLPNLAHGALRVKRFVPAAQELLKATWRCDHGVALYGFVDITKTLNLAQERLLFIFGWDGRHLPILLLLVEDYLRDVSILG